MYDKSWWFSCESSEHKYKPSICGLLTKYEANETCIQW